MVICLKPSILTRSKNVKKSCTPITRWGKFDKVMNGLAAAKAAGLNVKINTVALKGVNDDEFDRMIAWCGEEGFDLTFIEVMPMGDIGGEDRIDQYLPLSLLRGRLREKWTLDEIDYKTGGPARYVRVAETGGRIGFITPMTHNFCESCNRVRRSESGRYCSIPSTRTSSPPSPAGASSTRS